ncbi:hypothetical protein NQD34_005913 [Periophthalmus magnuspinnatus]|nr:hypothetical protein NQD34_005913 [Periophthalmus magnuspinnatus]
MIGRRRRGAHLRSVSKQSERRRRSTPQIRVSKQSGRRSIIPQVRVSKQSDFNKTEKTNTNAPLSRATLSPLCGEPSDTYVPCCDPRVPFVLISNIPIESL